MWIWNLRMVRCIYFVRLRSCYTRYQVSDLELFDVINEGVAYE